MTILIQQIILYKFTKNTDICEAYNKVSDSISILYLTSLYAPNTRGPRKGFGFCCSYNIKWSSNNLHNKIRKK